jgi:MFS family permease
MLHALAILMLALSDSTVAVILFVGLFSAGNGALTIMRATIVANVFGLSAYGGISGMIGFMSQAAVAVGPLGVSLLVVVWGGYQPVFWLLTGLIALSAAGIFRVKETVPKAPARQT